MKFGSDFKSITHALDAQLKAVRDKLRHEEAFADTVPTPRSAFDDLPEAKKQEIKQDKWHRNLVS
jgi:hypothetical protein